MGRCLLLQSGLPQTLWPYAIQTAAHIRNRCFNKRTKTTPYFRLTGKAPDLSKMWIFGSECFAYEQEHKKLDSRCSKGVFVGYDKNSPSYLVVYPQNGKIMKHRLIRFIKKGSVEQHTQTDESSRDCDVHEKSDHDTRSDLDSMSLPKYVLRYLKGTMDYELCFKKSDADLQLTAYSDSDWASCLEDRRRTTGYCCTLTEGGPLISWKSRRQPTVAISTCEAE
jgi:hypothetical protein